jgi:hypothetical protein
MTMTMIMMTTMEQMTMTMIMMTTMEQMTMTMIMMMTMMTMTATMTVMMVTNTQSLRGYSRILRLVLLIPIFKYFIWKRESTF